MSSVCRIICKYLISHGLIVFLSVLSACSLVSTYSFHINFLEIDQGNTVERRSRLFSKSSLSQHLPISQLILLK